MARGIKLVCMESGWYVDLRGRIGEFNNCVMFFICSYFLMSKALALVYICCHRTPNDVGLDSLPTWKIDRSSKALPGMACLELR